ncbi:MAG: hypothetical protein AAGD25_00475 [Cyanobacteria bacterium P01_F01_bin.150]
MSDFSAFSSLFLPNSVDYRAPLRLDSEQESAYFRLYGDRTTLHR